MSLHLDHSVFVTYMRSYSVLATALPRRMFSLLVGIGLGIGSRRRFKLRTGSSDVTSLVSPLFVNGKLMEPSFGHVVNVELALLSKKAGAGCPLRWLRVRFPPAAHEPRNKHGVAEAWE